MSRPGVALVPPVKFTLDATRGHLLGSNGRYEKRWPDLRGVYRDAEAFDRRLAVDDGRPVYWVEHSRTEDGPGGLITGICVLEPGRVGDEYFMTRGHLHAIEDRSELYVCIAGRGVMLLETRTGDGQATEFRAGEGVYVPGHWIHRSVNVGAERLVMMFCYASDAGQDYEVIERAGGMRQLVVEADGRWTTRPNSDHRGYGA
jgi:glucose-6-phosphate isomerase